MTVESSKTVAKERAQVGLDAATISNTADEESTGLQSENKKKEGLGFGY